MAEAGRVPKMLRLCRDCREFVHMGKEDCDICGANLDAAEAHYDTLWAEAERAAAHLRNLIANAR
jgi:hypothetical protein